MNLTWTTPREEAEALSPVLERLRSHFMPEQIWLFGSRGEGRGRPGSDFDLLLVMSDDAPSEHLQPAVAWHAVKDLGLPIDIVPCTRSEFEEEKTELDSLPRAAMTRGRLLSVRAA